MMTLEKIKITSLISMLLLIIGHSQTVKDDSVFIAENSKAKAVIVISEDASESEQHAAKELANWDSFTLSIVIPRIYSSGNVKVFASEIAIAVSSHKIAVSRTSLKGDKLR